MKKLINDYFTELIAMQEDLCDVVELGEVWQNLIYYIDKNSAASSGNTSGITPNNGETLSEKESIVLTKREFNFLMMIAEAQQNEHYNKEYSNELIRIAEQKNYDYQGRQPCYINKEFLEEIDNPVASIINLWNTPEFEFLTDTMRILGLNTVSLGDSGYKLSKIEARETDKEQPIKKIG